MKVAALLSGGKDSCYNMLECVRHGHEITCLVNLLPADESINELDSFMYQTVGHNAIDAIAQAMDLPLIRVKITGKCIESELKYTPHEGDEVEDLYIALKQVKERFPEIEGVSSGAILSNYQRERVENVCHRLGFVSLAYLWRREQRGLLGDMVENGIDAILIKTATIGLNKQDIGKSIIELHDKLCRSETLYGCNPCGEGGEYETFTLDSPLYKKRIVIDDYSIICHSYDRDAPVYLYVPNQWHLEDKHDIQPIQYEVIQPVLPSLPQSSSASASLTLPSPDSLSSSSSGNSIQIVIPPSLSSSLPSFFTEITNPPLLTIFHSDSLSQPVIKTYHHSNLHTQTWYSRSLWCPPALFPYSLYAFTNFFYSIPFILPLESQSLLYCSSSPKQAYLLCKEYQSKIQSIISRSIQPVVTSLFMNEQFPPSELPLEKEKCLIVGTVDSIEKDCSIQYGCKGVLLNDEDVIEECCDDHHYKFTFGEHAQFDVYCLEKMDLSLTIPSHQNTEITVYFDSEKVADCSIFDEFIHSYNPMLIPVKKLGMKCSSKDIIYHPIIIEITSFN